jgi:hypothetical protein
MTHQRGPEGPLFHNLSLFSSRFHQSAIFVVARFPALRYFTVQVSGEKQVPPLSRSFGVLAHLYHVFLARQHSI